MKLKHYLFFIFSSVLSIFSAAKKTTVGGQAIIEGVMMRSKNKISWAIRKGPNDVVIEKEEFISIARKYPILRKPILRGAISLYESMVIGYKALSRSAEITTEAENLQNPDITEKKDNKNMEKFYSILSFVVALAISMGLFMYAPMWIISKFVPKDSAILFNTLGRVMRMVFFLGYLILISMWKEIKRVFEYHGAEHKAIFTFEDGKELTFANMQSYSTLHPRCGTSFLLLVGMICILLFSIVDALYIGIIGPYHNVLTRFFVHMMLLPIVSGASYEVIETIRSLQEVSPCQLVNKTGSLVTEDNN